MPKVQFDHTKGLHQKSGGGFEYVSSVDDGTDACGFHRWVETITLQQVSANSDVMGIPSFYIPAGGVITDAAIIAQEIATTGADNTDVQLHIHTSAVAVDDGTAGTEIVGADASNKSIPDDNLNIGKNGANGDTVMMGSLGGHDLAGNPGYPLIVESGAGGDSAIGNPKVTLVIEWYGRPAVLV